MAANMEHAENNLASLLAQHLGTPDKILYSQYENGAWRDYSATEVAQLAARWQAAFRAQGMARGDRVALCVKNGVNWVAIDQAALGLGLVLVPLYLIDNPGNVAWCVSDSAARLLVLENARMLEALQATLTTMPTIVCLQRDVPDSTAIGVDKWLPRAALPFEVQPLEPDALASIVYTSGTTGRPKGVMLSHRNIMSNVDATLEVVTVHPTDVLVSVLPLSHMFERTCGYYAPLRAGARVAFSRGVSQLAEDLALHRPTILVAVPRVYDRFLARIGQKLEESPFKRWLFHLTVKLGWRVFNGEASTPERLLYGRLRKLVAGPILARLGGRLRLAAAGGAALEARIARAFIGLGLPLIQGYGLTEASPVVAANRADDNDPASVGYPLRGFEVRLNEAHELLVRGPSVMQGYWQHADATRAVLSADGWLNTGDLADIRDGKLYIKGRSKDILVLSNGEKLPPEEAEMAILEDPVFEQVMLFGEGRPSLVLLAVTQESDERELVRRANAQLKQFPRYVRVRRVVATKEPWTVENGLLTPTLKAKRTPLAAHFAREIEAAYRG